MEEEVSRGKQLCILSVSSLKLNEYFIIEHSLLRKSELFLLWAIFIKRIHLKWKKRICFHLHHFVKPFLFQGLRSMAEKMKSRLTHLTVVTLYLAAQPWKFASDIENMIPYLKIFLPGAFILNQHEQRTIH